MKYILPFDRIDELIKSDNFLKYTSTPYSAGGLNPESKFAEYDASHKEGWKLKGVIPVDSKGNSTGKEMDIEKFLRNYPASYETLKKSISASLSSLVNQPWIDEYTFIANKSHATIYIGTLGFRFGEEYFSPILEYPSTSKSGNTFWIGANIGRDREGDISLFARTILVFPYDVSDADIQAGSLQAINSSRLRRWYLNNQEIQAENEILAREGKPLKPLMNKPVRISETRFYPEHVVVREPNQKDFFVIYLYGIGEEEIEQYAKSAVTGETFKPSFRKSKIDISDTEEMKRGYNKKWNLFPTDSGLKAFWYFNTGGKNSNLESDKWNYLIIDRALMPKSAADNFRILDVIDRKGKKFALRISAGDKVKVPKLYKDTSGKKTIDFNESEVMKLDTKDKKNISIKWI